MSDESLLTDLADALGDPGPIPAGLDAACKAAFTADVRAWTIHQPYASAIVGRPGGAGGPKPLDNRGLEQSRRGLVLIHAARPGAYDKTAKDRCAPLRRWLGSEDCPDDWMFSAIIGAAVITGCHQCDGSCSEWAEPGMWHVKLGRRFAFETPVPASGALGFWKVRGDVRDPVLRQLKAVAA